MWKRIWGGRERRRRRRHDLALDVEIETNVEIYGFEPTARPFFSSGTTVNLSETGMLAHIDAPIALDSKCSVYFRDGHEQLRTMHTAGRVTRCQERDGDFVIAIEFDVALSHLRVETLATSGLSQAARRSG